MISSREYLNHIQRLNKIYKTNSHIKSHTRLEPVFKQRKHLKKKISRINEEALKKKLSRENIKLMNEIDNI